MCEMWLTRSGGYIRASVLASTYLAVSLDNYYCPTMYEGLLIFFLWCLALCGLWLSEAVVNRAQEKLLITPALN